MTEFEAYESLIKGNLHLGSFAKLELVVTNKTKRIRPRVWHGSAACHRKEPWDISHLIGYCNRRTCLPSNRNISDHRETKKTVPDVIIARDKSTTAGRLDLRKPARQAPLAYPIPPLSDGPLHCPVIAFGGRRKGNISEQAKHTAPVR